MLLIFWILLLCGTSGTASIEKEDRLTTEYDRVKRWNVCDDIVMLN